MKRFLIATAALTLMGGGAVYAQSTTQPTSPTTSPMPATSTPPAAPSDTTPPAATPASPDPSSAPASPAPTTTPDTTSAAPMPSTQSTPMASSTTPTVVGDLAQTNPPPADGSYPVCKSRKQDRCVVGSQAHHAAMAKRKMASKTAPGA